MTLCSLFLMARTIGEWITEAENLLERSPFRERIRKLLLTEDLKGMSMVLGASKNTEQPNSFGTIFYVIGKLERRPEYVSAAAMYEYLKNNCTLEEPGISLGRIIAFYSDDNRTKDTLKHCAFNLGKFNTGENLIFHLSPTQEFELESINEFWNANPEFANHYRFYEFNIEKAFNDKYRNKKK
jgi:hypothetical protein